jgi:signal transduction histidine kinase
MNLHLANLHLTARARLTLLYTALVAASGGVLVTVTYFLVAHNLNSTQSGTTKTLPSANAVNKCIANGQLKNPTDPNLKSECLAFFQQGADAGAQAQRDTTLTHLLGYSLATLIAITILAALAGWILAGRILRPIHQLTAAARTASEHTLSQRLELRGPRDELRELADTFDDMLARLDTAFASQQRFIANASHELRTPLTVMRTTVDVVLAKPAPTNDELTEMGTDIRQAVEHAEQLIGALLTLARNDRGRTPSEPVDLAPLAEDALDGTAINGLHLNTTLDPATLNGDPILLERLIANLLDNAVRYNTPNGTITLSTGAADHQAFVRVMNTGPLILPEQVESLFQPFTRLNDRTDHHGFGLGLALAASITTAHNGTVNATANPSGGLDITVHLPTGPAAVTGSPAVTDAAAEHAVAQRE